MSLNVSALTAIIALLGRFLSLCCTQKRRLGRHLHFLHHHLFPRNEKIIVLLWERQVTGRFKFRHLLGKLWRMSNNGIVSASVTMSAEVPFEHPNFSTRMKLYCAACRCANVHLFVWNMNPVSVPLCLVNQSTKCNELDSECSRGGGRHLIISAWLCKVNSLWHFPKPAPPPAPALHCSVTSHEVTPAAVENAARALRKRCKQTGKLSTVKRKPTPWMPTDTFLTPCCVILEVISLQRRSILKTTHACCFWNEHSGQWDWTCGIAFNMAKHPMRACSEWRLIG